MSQVRMNPFPGLRPFGEEEDYLFFGREEQTNDLLELLRTQRFLAVVGTSGSGKSSLVRAGMLPSLYGGTMASVGSDWETVVFRPGGDPMLNLADAMIAADLYDPQDPEAPLQVRATLSRSRQGLVQAVEYSDMPAGSNLLIVVDQFEELFRFRGTSDKHQELATAFVKLLLNAAKCQTQSIYVVITMRSDYLGDCAHLPGLAEAVNDGKYLIPKLTRDQRRDAIVMPAAVGGGKISESLVQQLLNDVGDDADQLPILQHALMRIWDYWEHDHADDEPVSLRHYDAAGGMDNALSNHADEVYDELPSDDSRSLARLVFQTITERGGDERGIRRPTRMDQLCHIVDASHQDIQVVLDAYRKVGRTFVMPIEGQEITQETVVDISHESLMRVWRRLTHWVEEESQNARVYTRLAETAELHERELAGVYRDPDLAIALSWRETASPTAAWGKRYRDGFEQAIAFLDKSYETTHAEEIAREEARERELEQARLVATLQSRARKRLTVLMCCIAAALVGAVVMYFDSVEARSTAEASALENKQLALEASKSEQAALTSEKAAKESEAEAQRQTLLAEENATKADEQAKAAEEARKLADQQARDAELAKKEARRSLYFSQLYKTTHEEDQFEQFNVKRQFVRDWAPRPSLEDLRSWEWYYIASRPNWIKHAYLAPTLLMYKPIAFFPDGNEFYLARSMNVIEKRDTVTEEIKSRLFLDYEITAISALPDGKRLLLAGRDRVLRVVDATSGIVEREFYLRHGLGNEIIKNQMLSDDGQKAYIANSKGAFYVDLGDNSLHKINSTGKDPEDDALVAISSGGAVMSHDGSVVIAQSKNRGLYAYDFQREIWEHKREINDITYGDFSHDDKLIALSREKGKVTLLHASDYSTFKEIDLNVEEDVRTIAWAPSDKEIILSLQNGEQFGISIESDEPVIQSLPRTELSVWAYYWFPNNKGLATYGLIGELYISENPFDPSTANQLENITSTGSYRNQMCFTSDGKYIILINSNGLEVYDPASGKLIKNISTSNYESITLSNDESKFIVCRNGFTTKIFEVGTWEQIGQIQTPGVSCAAWSPDDKKVALGRVSRNTSFANALVSIYDHSDKSNPSLSGEFRVEGNLTAIAWNSTGTKIVTGGENTFEALKRVHLIDANSLETIKSVGGIVTSLSALSFIGDSNRVLVAGIPGIDLIDFTPETPTIKSATYKRGDLTGLQISRDQQRILVRGVGSGDVKLYDINTLEEVHTFSDDNFIHAEWNKTGEIITAANRDLEITKWDASDAYRKFGNSLPHLYEKNSNVISDWNDKEISAAVNSYIEDENWDAATNICESFFSFEANEFRNPIQSNWWISPLSPSGLDDSTALDESPDIFRNGVPKDFHKDWRRISTNLDGVVSVDDWVGIQKYKSIFGLCRIYAPENQSYGIFMGSDDTHRLWINGDEVHSSRAKRPPYPDMDFVECELRKGWNTFLLKVYQFEGDFGWQLRITGQKDELVHGRIQNGEFLKANNLLAAALTETPDNDMLRHLRVHTSLFSNNFDQAIADSELLLEKYTSTELTRIRSDLLAKNGNLEEAVSTIDSVDESSLFDINSLFKLASLLKKVGKIERADSIFMRAVESSDHAANIINRARQEMESTNLISNAGSGGSYWRFTPVQPLDDSWPQFEFDDSNRGFVTSGVFKRMGGLGSLASDIWARTEFYIDDIPSGPIQISWGNGSVPVSAHLNGVPIFSKRSGMYNYSHPIVGPQARNTLRKGRNVLAVRLHNPTDNPSSNTPDIRLSVLDRPRAFAKAYLPIVDALESKDDRVIGLNRLANYEAGYRDFGSAIELLKTSIEGTEPSLANYHPVLGPMQLVYGQSDDALRTIVQFQNLLSEAEMKGIPTRFGRLAQIINFMDLPEPFASAKMKDLSEKTNPQSPVQFQAELAMRQGRYDDVAALLNSDAKIHSDGSMIYAKEIYLISRLLAGDYKAAAPIMRDMYREERSRFDLVTRDVFVDSFLNSASIYFLALKVSYTQEIINATKKNWESLSPSGFLLRAYALMYLANTRDFVGNHANATEVLNQLLQEYKQSRAAHNNSPELLRLDASLLWLLAKLSPNSYPELDLVSEVVQLIIQQRNNDTALWKSVEIQNANTQTGGEIFSIGNGTVRAIGDVPDNDIYTINVRPMQQTVTGIEVSVLDDSELATQGPGRAGFGNMHLTDIRVYRGTQLSPENELTLENYSVSFTQPNLNLLGITFRDGRQWGVAGQQGRRSKLVVNLAEPLTTNPNETITVQLHFMDPQWTQMLPSKVQIRTSDTENIANVPEYLFYDSVAPTDTPTLAALALYLYGNLEEAEKCIQISDAENNLSLYGWILLANIEKQKNNLDEAARWYRNIEDSADRWGSGEPLINRLFDEYHE